jgi:hypothetical protein
MANFLIKDTPFVFCGLGTLTYTIPAPGIYNVSVQSTETPPTGLSIVVNVNGSPVYTAPVITPSQSAIQFKKDFPALLNDVVTVVLASSAPVDLQLNTLKTTISCGNGQ